MLIDDVEVRIIAGKGGDGVVGFNKIKMHLGPTGANGGLGGSVYMEGISDLSALYQFRFKKEVKAQDGMYGSKQLRDGKGGEDTILKVPVGTVITNLDKNKVIGEITQIGERILIAKGGRGGRGNWSFRSSTNTTPYEQTDGKPGESFAIKLELKMIADIGLVGLPNSGKSSLLNELTGATSKVGNYQFTTLEPHLGAYYDLIIADIPGLIEGASDGKGLGHKFLRHVERTRVIFHLVSAESEDPWADYETVRAELIKFSRDLESKTEYVLLTKTDNATDEQIAAATKLFKKHKIDVMPTSIVIAETMDRVRTILNEIAVEKRIVLTEKAEAKKLAEEAFLD